MTDAQFDALMTTLNTPKTTPAWLRKATKGMGSCAQCHSQYAKAELNAQKHCRHCADELMEAHPLIQS